MTIARAPLRISFAGGGTDLDAYAHAYGGVVVSAAITLYATAQTTDLPTRNHAILNACQEEAIACGWIPRPRSVAVTCDVPPGTGLGSSSATAVACLALLHGFADNPELLARAACAVEIDRLAAPIGRQDQYASAFGGINVIRFAGRGGVSVVPMQLMPETQALFERRLMLFRDGVSRDARTILSEQHASIRTDSGTRTRMHALAALAEQCFDRLVAGDLDGVAQTMDAGWSVKRGIAGVTTHAIDTAYHAARAAGARGGKLCGAGGGGHLLLYVPEDRQDAMRVVLRPLGLTQVPFAFDMQGVRVSDAQ